MTYSCSVVTNCLAWTTFNSEYIVLRGLKTFLYFHESKKTFSCLQNKGGAAYLSVGRPVGGVWVGCASRWTSCRWWGAHAEPSVFSIDHLPPPCFPLSWSELWAAHRETQTREITCCTSADHLFRHSFQPVTMTTRFIKVQPLQENNEVW